MKQKEFDALQIGDVLQDKDHSRNVCVIVGARDPGTYFVVGTREKESKEDPSIALFLACGASSWEVVRRHVPLPEECTHWRELPEEWRVDGVKKWGVTRGQRKNTVPRIHCPYCGAMKPKEPMPRCGEVEATVLQPLLDAWKSIGTAWEAIPAPEGSRISSVIIRNGKIFATYQPEREE